ncbi:MAG: hypothetical protein DRR03_07245 [Gammaproteobacteria bacterium]|nr:MAG: hypothetical protein DRR03_07245 [Gammaproteobacteria bacterium]
MSYILDALRRADDERQRHGPRTPVLAPGPATPSTSHHTQHRHGGISVVAITLAVTVILVLTVAWFWPGQGQPPGNTTGNAGPTPARELPALTDTPRIESETAPAIRTEVPDEPVTRPAVRPPTQAPVNETDAETAAGEAITAVALPTPVSKTARTATTPDTQPESTAPATGSTPIVEAGDLPTAWRDLPLSQRKNLPHPRLDVHVYDSDPERRFVMIELRKYHEGDALPDGSILERIFADGIVLGFRDQRYTRPRR